MATARFVLEARTYRPILSIPKITGPVLFIAATTDKLCPKEKVEAAAALAKHGELMSVDCNHFEIYSGATFDLVIQRQIAFVKKVAGLPEYPRVAGAGQQTQDLLAAEADLGALIAGQPEVS
jgi:dienelactone hydrolase